MRCDDCFTLIDFVCSECDMCFDCCDCEEDEGLYYEDDIWPHPDGDQ